MYSNDICESCFHKNVCKNVELFTKAQETVKETRVNILEENNAMSVIKLSDIDFIKNINLHCMYFHPKDVNPTPTFRGGSNIGQGNMG